MPRPSMTTPVETTVALLRSAADWADANKEHLAKVFGEDYDGKSKAEALADRLETAEENYVREQREDVGLTNRRDEAVAKAQQLVSSGLALAQIVFADADNVDDILADFAAEPPSRIRSPQMARKALTRLTAALEIHKKPMKKVLANLSDFKKTLRDTVDELEDVAAANASEAQETRAARRERDAARQEAVNFARNLQLAAEAMEFFQPDALADLLAIYDAHNPASTPRTSDEGASAPAPAPPEAPTGDSGAPSDAGEPVAGDGSGANVGDQPVEA